MEAQSGPVSILVLTEQYEKEFQDARQYFYDVSLGFKSAIVESQDVLMQIQKDEQKRMDLGIVTPLKNLAPIALADMEFLKYFSWLAIMQFVYWIAFNFLAPLLWPLLSLSVTHTQALLLIINIPMMTYQHIDVFTDMGSRYLLLVFSAAEGLAMGHLFENYHLALPLPFVMPLMIAVCAHLFTQTNEKSSRMQFLAASLLGGLLINLAIGWILDLLLFSYVIVSVLSVASALIILQYYIDHYANDYVKNPYFYMLVLFCLNICIQALLLLLCASTSDN